MDMHLHYTKGPKGITKVTNSKWVHSDGTNPSSVMDPKVTAEGPLCHPSVPSVHFMFLHRGTLFSSFLRFSS